MNYIIPMLTAVIWGLCYTSIEKIISHVDKRTYIILLTIISAMTNLAILLPTHKGFIKDLQIIKYNKDGITTWVAIAIIATIIGNYMSILSVEKTNAATAASLEITYPFWCLIFSYFIINKEFTDGILFGGLFIFLGVIIITSSN